MLLVQLTGDFLLVNSMAMLVHQHNLEIPAVVVSGYFFFL